MHDLCKYAFNRDIQYWYVQIHIDRQKDVDIILQLFKSTAFCFWFSMFLFVFLCVFARLLSLLWWNKHLEKCTCTDSFMVIKICLNTIICVIEYGLCLLFQKQELHVSKFQQTVFVSKSSILHFCAILQSIGHYVIRVSYIVGTDGLLWWSSSQVLVTTCCVCGVHVCVCVLFVWYFIFY